MPSFQQIALLGQANILDSDLLYRALLLAVILFHHVPLGFQVRGYAQAGWVGGDYATAFVDGQIVADREVAAFDLGKTRDGSLRVGGGAWGGAQRNAERLDAGPSASLVVPVADAPVRLSVDYRFRILGDAEPDSGVAVTLSTGF